MQVVVINTGTELLLGDVVNTHLAFIGQAIFPLGLRIDRQLAVPDGPSIREALGDALGHADLIFVTGGLGPTTDDVTREITAELLGLDLREDERVAHGIRQRLAQRNIRLTDRILRQAQVPAGATVLENRNGTAPGLYLLAQSNMRATPAHLFLLPGPPRELRPMFQEFVGPMVRRIVPAQANVEHRSFRFAGIGESIIEERVGKKILALGAIELGYCARPAEVDLRLIGDRPSVEAAAALVRREFREAIFSDQAEELENVIVKMLTERRETLVTAESCSGGLIAHRITNVPGASAVFIAGFISYANSAKSEILGVTPALLHERGAVSEEVARAMADRARARAGTNYALATTGIAGPDGGTEAKPVGTVFIALSANGAPTTVQKLFFPGDRATFKQMTSQFALEMLRRLMLRR